MTATPSPTIQSTDALGDLVNRYPQLVPMLDRMHLDYCCGGRRSLAEACLAAGLAVEEAVDALRTSAIETPTPSSSLQDLAHAAPSVLVDHIVQTHHAYLRHELPRLSELAERVVSAHGDRHPEVVDVRDTFGRLRADVEPHLDREEQILFPLVREMDAALRSGRSANGELANPVSVLADDHEQVGDLLARLRSLTDDFTPPADGCASYRALYDGLHDLMDDTHLHVHKENNILFPAAVERERQLKEQIGA
jgi:regulator of cell morphogenesis and NO signaling